jgi:hypothetical protein
MEVKDEIVKGAAKSHKELRHVPLPDAGGLSFASQNPTPQLHNPGCLTAWGNVSINDEPFSPQKNPAAEMIKLGPLINCFSLFINNRRLPGAAQHDRLLK